MSMFVPTTQDCPRCGTSATFDTFMSVNADRRADLRFDILSGEFMTVTCAACGAEFRLEPDLNYLDMERGTWILARPIDALVDWGEEEAIATEMFADAFGVRAPASAQEIGETLSPRLTFGWPAFREKLVIEEAGLDDVVVEEVKLFILHQRPDNPLDEGIELRLLESTGDSLTFGWVEGEGGELVEAFRATFDLYDAVRGDLQWRDLGAQISSGLFVDAQRLFIEPAAPEETSGPAQTD